MGMKLLKQKKSKQRSAKNLSTPSKAGAKNSVSTPDTEPGSPVPDEDVILPASSTPNAFSGSTPTPYNKRIMEGETPLISNVASSPQLNRSSSGVPQLSSTPVKSNRIRDEIGQYYAQRDAKEMPRQQPKKKTVMRTYAQPVVGVRAFSIDESEEVELQLSSDVPFAAHPPRNKTAPRPRPVNKVVPKFVSKPNQDELSVPSVITGPDGDTSEKVTSTANKSKQKNEKKQGPESAWSKVSLTNKIIDGGQTIDDAIKSLIGGDTTKHGLDQMTSAATQAGGIEQLLGLLQCNEDTTCGTMLQCDALCGSAVEKDLVDLENEQEQEFAIKFNNVSLAICAYLIIVVIFCISMVAYMSSHQTLLFH